MKKTLKELSKDNRGNISFAIYFVVVSVILLFIFAFTIPFLMDLNTRLYQAGETILIDGEGAAAKIQDVNVRTQIQAALSSSKSSIPDQIDVLGSFFEWAWLIIIIIVGVMYFLYARQSVEYSSLT